GNRSHGHSGTKAFRVSHGVERHRPAIRPPPDRHTALVELRVLREKLIERSELILQFNRAELMPDRRLELSVAPRRSAIVDRKNCESLPRKDLIKRIHRFF